MRLQSWPKGHGLFAIGVQWTEKAKAMIQAREYRYISPAFTFSAVTGQVERMLGAGLTNTPGLTALTDLAQVAVNARQPVGTTRATSREIEAFNAAFGASGLFHPDTPPAILAERCGNAPKPVFPAALKANDPHGSEALYRLCPEAWQAF